MSKCKRCNQDIVWPQPYVKGQPPLDPGTRQTHDCPNWNKEGWDIQQQTQTQPQTQQPQEQGTRATYDVAKQLQDMNVKLNEVIRQLERSVSLYDNILDELRNHRRADAEAAYDQDKEDGTAGDFS